MTTRMISGKRSVLFEDARGLENGPRKHVAPYVPCLQSSCSDRQKTFASVRFRILLENKASSQNASFHASTAAISSMKNSKLPVCHCKAEPVLQQNIYQRKHSEDAFR
jgi:hypothetical protein